MEYFFTQIYFPGNKERAVKQNLELHVGIVLFYTHIIFFLIILYKEKKIWNKEIVYNTYAGTEYDIARISCVK